MQNEMKWQNGKYTDEDDDEDESIHNDTYTLKNNIYIKTMCTCTAIFIIAVSSHN